MSQLWYFKLSNGDEIISETLPSDNENYYILSNPLEVKDVMDERSGITAVILQDYSPYTLTKTGIRLFKSQVVSHALCDGSMSSYYDASLEYITQHGSVDAEKKIQRAADHLRLYTLKLGMSQEEKLEELFSEERQELEDEDAFGKKFLKFQ